MTRDDFLNLPCGGEPPVRCADGHFGLLILFPGDDGLCGVQVPGEEHTRMVDCSKFAASEGGALVEQAPILEPDVTLVMIAEILIAAVWADLGGNSVSAVAPESP
jgi:hypothetical protein